MDKRYSINGVWKIERYPIEDSFPTISLHIHQYETASILFATLFCFHAVVSGRFNWQRLYASADTAGFLSLPDPDSR